MPKKSDLVALLDQLHVAHASLRGAGHSDPGVSRLLVAAGDAVEHGDLDRLRAWRNEVGRVGADSVLRHKAWSSTPAHRAFAAAVKAAIKG